MTDSMLRFRRQSDPMTPRLILIALLMFISFAGATVASAQDKGTVDPKPLTPMPNRQLSRNEREETSAVMMVRDDRLDIDPKVFTPGHLAVIRDAAQEPTVQRIFVNAAIKKALCREAKGDRSWLSKVRPMYGHDYHFHIRIRCPPGGGPCEGQPEPSTSEGCSAGDLAYWFKDSVIHPKPPPEP